MDIATYRRRSKGWQQDPPAYIHSRILFGPGMFIEPKFVEMHKITHIINCAFDKDSPVWFQTQYPTRYVCLDAVDTLEANILDWYIRFEKTIHTFLRDPECVNIYVHCQCGINRSGFLCLAFMNKRLGIEYISAVKTILKQRPCALTNPNYQKQLYEFSEKKG